MGLYWAPVLIIMALIFIGSTRVFSSDNTSHWLVPILQSVFPDAGLQTLSFMVWTIRKCAHVVEYAILTILTWRALWFGPSRRPAIWSPVHAWWAFAIATLYGASDEFHQTFVPSRMGSVTDIVADAMGSLIALAIIYGFCRMRSGKDRELTISSPGNI